MVAPRQGRRTVLFCRDRIGLPLPLDRTSIVEPVPAEPVVEDLVAVGSASARSSPSASSTIDWFEVRAGYQVFSWGTGDLFNPTNNLNPIDFSDLFDSRRMPVLATTVVLEPSVMTNEVEVSVRI